MDAEEIGSANHRAYRLGVAPKKASQSDSPRCAREQRKSGAGMSAAPIDTIARSYVDTDGPAFENYVSSVRNQGEKCGNGEMQRPRVQGKFLYVAGEHLWIRGVTYGTFRPDPAGVQFPPK